MGKVYRPAPWKGSSQMHHHSHRSPAVTRDMSAQLWKSAAAVLDANWSDDHMVPSRHQYPHQWSWDTAFTAIGLAYTNPTRAWHDLRHLFEAQWPDGRVPHIVFDPRTAEADYFPGLGFWNVPTYADRRTDHDYARYVGLVLNYRENGYADDDLAHRHPFVVECPSFNAIVGAAESALARIAAVLGQDPERHRRRAQRITDAIVDTLFDPDTATFRARDVRTGMLSPKRCVSGLVPLILPGLRPRHAAAIMAEAASPRFGLPHRRGLPVPSYDRTAADFDTLRYWRGPTWINVVRRSSVGPPPSRWTCWRIAPCRFPSTPEPRPDARQAITPTVSGRWRSTRPGAEPRRRWSCRNHARCAPPSPATAPAAGPGSTRRWWRSR